MRENPTSLAQRAHSTLALAIAAAEQVCHDERLSFPDLLRGALEEVDAATAGGITRTRPGSWEAADLRHLCAMNELL